MDKINKLSLPVTILIAAIILGGFYYASQQSKQGSIERQQWIEMQEKKVQQDRDFDVEQKKACLEIYKQESSKWNNVTSWRYDDSNDTCYIQYKSNPKPTKTDCDSQYKGDDGKVISFFFNDWLLCQDGLFEKSF